MITILFSSPISSGNIFRNRKNRKQIVSIHLIDINNDFFLNDVINERMNASRRQENKTILTILWQSICVEKLTNPVFDLSTSAEKKFPFCFVLSTTTTTTNWQNKLNFLLHSSILTILFEFKVFSWKKFDQKTN